MSNIKFNFEKKNVLVTGGAQGIGFEVALQFLDAGAQVIIWDYSEEALSNAQLQLKPYDTRVSFQQVDVSRFESCEAACASWQQSIDVLVNNAGITRDKSFAKMSVEDFDLVVKTDLNSLFYVTKACMSRFNENSKQNRIINISSVVALYGNFGQSNYVAAKAGVIGLTKTWAKEFARKGFTVNAIAPGFTKTAMVAAMPPEILGQLESKVPVQRLGTVGDIGQACLFLAAQEASYINGVVLSVDGGLILS